MGSPRPTWANQPAQGPQSGPAAVKGTTVVSESASQGVVGESPRETEEYVRWLKQESMLANANATSGQFSGVGAVWQSPFAIPNPAAAMAQSSVWFTAYPISMITKPGYSFLRTLGDEELWLAFQAIG